MPTTPTTPSTRTTPTGPSTKALREGSARKRAAILTAARELFLADGFDRTSVDAISARAKVSKRTVYDYFGDKQTLLRAVVDGVGTSLISTIRRTLDDTLTERAGADGLEEALIAFALRIATDTLNSAEYATLQRLVRVRDGSPRQGENPLLDTPEEALAERLEVFAAAGLLDIPDPRLAADHFIALTFNVTLNRLGSANAAEDPRVAPLLIEGVRAFLRAYPPPA